eukprot:CAMPEP_0185281488 /NCGR_PEP_ID=MMETSP1359-20130426/66749_1 /TAXON_ID=552665 /ORGANISM="Bigelowiella longifila, Strain CCMP242" /LENGTH=208 /DNA_ID=CAMNT_0027876931 /DNA_START=111 /DNA_END=738 /DNA_ORIENTATION=+
MTVCSHQRMKLNYRRAEEKDFERLYHMETRSYPPDEAASAKSLMMRIRNASDFFLVAMIGENVIGFINGTLTSDQKNLTHDSMSKHEPQGATLCIHSVVISDSLRRNGHGSSMLREYVRRITARKPQVKRILLLAKQHLLGFYGAGGFVIDGESEVVHGKDLGFSARWPSNESSEEKKVRSDPILKRTGTEKNQLAKMYCALLAIRRR